MSDLKTKASPLNHRQPEGKLTQRWRQQNTMASASGPAGVLKEKVDNGITYAL